MYTFFYICTCLALPIVGWQIRKMSSRPSGIFLFSFTLALSLWFVLYYLFFSNFISSYSILLFLSRINFILGIFGTYNLLFFVYYYHKKTSLSISYSTQIVFLTLLGIAAGIYIFTDRVIESLEWDRVVSVYREVPGVLYSLTAIAYLIFLVAFAFVWYRQVRRQSGLERVRLKMILIGIYTMMFLLLLLQVALPYFGIWIFEQQIIFLPLLLVLYISSILRRYYFSPIGYSLGKWLVWITSLILALFVYICTILLLRSGPDMGRFWSIDDPYYLINISLSVMVFYFLNSFLTSRFLWQSWNKSIKKDLFFFQWEISQGKTYAEMNRILSSHLSPLFRISRCEVIVFDDQNIEQFDGLKKYFEAGGKDGIFMNDIVFYDGLLKQSEMTAVIASLPEKTFLVFPLLESEKCIGLFILGQKRISDFYTYYEIQTLRKFSYFLSSHIRYITAYQDLSELSLSLDKKVDEKTIEYNNLINRQKEFISVISHEIKSPLSTAIFQSDSILHDLDAGTLSPSKLREEIEVLSTQLMRTGSLIGKLFAVQYYDNHDVNLFLERVHLVQFLEKEIELFSHMYRDITFLSQIDKRIRFVKIDKIQFQQVISNLLDNAVKYSREQDAIISIQVSKSDQGFTLIIEDNGLWFEGIDLESIFDKYTIGSNKKSWIGMGLYLCKKIVSMHGGSIHASVSDEYGWARFTLYLPILK